MACNCKKAKKFEEKYGDKEYENALAKVTRYGWRVIMFTILVVLAIVVTPIMIFVAIYKIAFGKNNTIVLPKFLGKYLKEKEDGEKLQNTH